MITSKAPLFHIFVTIKQPLSTIILKLIDDEIAQMSFWTYGIDKT